MSPSRKPHAYEKLTKAELIAKLFRNEEQQRAQADARRTLLDLEVFQEEIRTQNEELRRARADLQAAAARYEDLYEFAPFAYLTLDEHAVIREINHAGAGLLEGPRQRALGLAIVHMVHKDDHGLLYKHLAAARKDVSTVGAQLRLCTFEKNEAPVELLTRLMSTGTTFCYRMAISDLRTQRRVEAKRSELLSRAASAKAANDEKDRLLAVVSHELRTPLSPIRNAAEFLAANDEVLPSKLRGAVEMILRNVKAETRLIDDLLDFTRARRRKLTFEMIPLDLCALIRECVEADHETATAAHLRLTYESKGGDVWVRADAMRLRQVLANLLRNALSYTPPGGAVTIRSEARVPGSVTVSIRDTGRGIVGEALQRIFEPFEQEARGPSGGGLGLGLAISKELIEAHGGTIRATSDGPGTGATFEFTLRTVAALVGTQASRTRESGARAPRLRVLIVEDHADTAATLAELLEARGFRTRLAGTLKAALQVSDEDFDVVVSDIALPDGSGWDLVRALRSQVSVPAIAISGFGSDEDRAKSAAAGFAVHMTKPVDVSKLIGTIEDLGKGAGRRPTRARSTH